MTVYFAHITDTHIGPDRDFERHGHNSWRCAQQLVHRLNHLPTKPHFVMHTGDVVNDPDPDAYALSAELFRQLDMPIYFTTGNHDCSADICHYLNMGPHDSFMPETGKLDYAFDCNGERILVLDGKIDPIFDPQGGLNEAQLALVAREMTPYGPPISVFTHFPALRMNSPWMDANMLLQNGQAFHKLLLPARDRLRAVYHGHVHQPMQTFRDGVRYVCAPSTFSQFAAWTVDVHVRMDSDALPGYNFVHMLPEQTIVHTHTFPRPVP